MVVVVKVMGLLGWQGHSKERAAFRAILGGDGSVMNLRDLGADREAQPQTALFAGRREGAKKPAS